MYIKREGIYCNDLQATVQLIQQWLSVNGEFKSLALVPQGWVSQLVLCVCWNPEEVATNAREGADVLARGGQTGREQQLPSSLFLCRLPEEGCGPN